MHGSPVRQITRRASNPPVRSIFLLRAILLCWVFLACLGCGETTSGQSPQTIIVNSLEDIGEPPNGAMTLRAAINQTATGGRITFDPSLSGKTIELEIVGATHSVLRGEVYSGMQFLGYQERDYGRSALYARKDIRGK